jgi:hypothetical protein
MRHLFWLLVACEPSLSRPTSSQTIPIAGRPIELAAGDLDGDRRPDLVVATIDGTVAIRLQRGEWTAGASIATRAHLVALGDVDADGTLDLVTTHHDSADVAVFLGDGKGAFRALPPVRALAAAKPHNHGLIVADLDGDRDADVVVADQQARVVVVLISDGGTLVARAPTALPQQPYPPEAGDLDRDGDLDIVVPLIGARSVAVLLNDGTGTFTPAAASPFETARDRPYGIALGDVDGNGTPDAIVSHDDTDVIAVLAGDGRGRLAQSRAFDTRRRVGRPTLVDLDGDGVLDFVAAGSGQLVIAGGASRFTDQHAEPAGGWRVIAADFDGNGRADLAAPDPDAGVVRLWRR